MVSQAGSKADFNGDFDDYVWKNAPQFGGDKNVFAGYPRLADSRSKSHFASVT